MAGDGESTGSKFSKWCCVICCCLFCLIFLTIGIVFAVIAANFDKPEVTVSKVESTGSAVTATEATMKYKLTLRLDNPNGWPFSGSIELIEADVYSLDKAASNKVGQSFYMAKARTTEPFEVKENAVTYGHIDFNAVIKASGDSLALYNRLERDCGAAAQATGSPTTKLRTTVRKAVVKFMRSTFDLSGLNVNLDFDASC